MKAVITSATFQKEFESKFGPMFSHKIQYDGKTAYYNSKNKDQKTFVAGQEAEFDEEEKQGANGKYLTIKPIKKAFTGSSNFARAVKKEQSRYSGFAMSYAKDLVVAGKIEMKDLEVYTRKMFNLMIELDKGVEND